MLKKPRTLRHVVLFSFCFSFWVIETMKKEKKVVWLRKKGPLSAVTGAEYLVEEMGEGGNDVSFEEREERQPEAVKEVWAGGARRGRHGLEVGPSGLLDEAVAD